MVAQWEMQEANSWLCETESSLWELLYDGSDTLNFSIELSSAERLARKVGSPGPVDQSILWNSSG